MALEVMGSTPTTHPIEKALASARVFSVKFVPAEQVKYAGACEGTNFISHCDQREPSGSLFYWSKSMGKKSPQAASNLPVSDFCRESLKNLDNCACICYNDVT